MTKLKEIMLLVIIGHLLLIGIYLHDIRSELKHTKELLHLQNKITNQIFMEITDMRKNRK